MLRFQEICSVSSRGRCTRWITLTRAGRFTSRTAGRVPRCHTSPRWRWDTFSGCWVWACGRLGLMRLYVGISILIKGWEILAVMLIMRWRSGMEFYGHWCSLHLLGHWWEARGHGCLPTQCARREGEEGPHSLVSFLMQTWHWEEGGRVNVILKNYCSSKK
jgi:hypothetical protein